MVIFENIYPGKVGENVGVYSLHHTRLAWPDECHATTGRAEISLTFAGLDGPESKKKSSRLQCHQPLSYVMEQLL
jgi:hypothetical protein